MRPYEEMGLALINHFGSVEEVLAHKRHVGEPDCDTSCEKCLWMPYVVFEYKDNNGTGKCADLSDTFWDAPFWYIKELMEEVEEPDTMTEEEFEELYGEEKEDAIAG